MDNSVIVVDSSDDETEEPNAKRQKKMQNKTNSSVKCVVGQRVLVSNKHISIEKSQKKAPTDNRSKPSKTLTKIVKPVQSVVVPSVLPPFHQNHVVLSANDKNPVASGDGKDFRRKINTAEITIVPINKASSPTISPKITQTTNSIEISPILTIPKTTPPKSSSGVSSTSPASSATSLKGITIKRITPVTVSNVVSKQPSTDSDALSKDSFNTIDDQAVSDNGVDKGTPSQKRPKIEKTPINEAFTELLDACRAADQTTDMEKLIKCKLIRYYQSVHPDFVNSKSFCKHALAVAAEIRAQPNFVYMKLSGILEELNNRRKSGETVVADEETASTGDERKDYQIRKLNKALYLIKKKIAKLDEAEVDWDDEHNSTFMLLEAHKKRAWQIFEKICDITGESKNAQRLVKKPIKFKGTKYPQFNRTLQTFVNNTQMFPDMFDVLKCLDHCNIKYNYGMSKEECKAIAQDAFLQIGEALQKRRKTDLYETASYFTGTMKDPALEDTELLSKLNQNQKYHDRIKELIEKFSSQQDPSKSDMNSSNETAAKAPDKSDDRNFVKIDLDSSYASSNNGDTGKSDKKIMNNNNSARFDSSSTPLLTIVAVTSLQPDDPLLEIKDESNIVISDDEES